ncbi:MAG: type II secretion system protein [Candidatus Liptonbacteria bacterium]|nr:type II secretion system protein [Parcubacteria group bacterium]MBI4087553.1 type II secretion system protein [Candidatus Liptonbacteria bacterium]
MTSNTKKGFTLIELLVVIAIIAVLSVVVILTLNPAEILRQARDSNRISDLSTLKSGISFFLSDVSTSSSALGVSGRCYMAAPGSSTCSWFTTAASYATTTVRTVNGAGWIPINFNAISSGAPFGNLPADPTNNASYFYSYIANATSGFKLAARMESTKYNASGSSDIVSTDGGNDNTTYETGSVLGL